MIQAVYGDLLGQTRPLRFVLADDPGADEKPHVTRDAGGYADPVRRVRRRIGERE